MTQTLWQLGVTLPWAASAILLALPRKLDRLAGPLATAHAFVLAGLLAVAIGRDPSPDAPVAIFAAELASPVGLELIFRRDGLSQLFAAVTVLSYLLVTLYAVRYLPHEIHEKHSRRTARGFHALMAAFAAAMLGLVTSENLLQLYVFWELTSISSFLLIAFFWHDQAAREGGRRALSLTFAGGLFLLAALLVLGVQGGSWDFRVLLAQPHGSARGEFALPAALLAIAALSKSAQFPFMRWLPSAMAAPTPVSAFLHSAALVAAGVFVTSRFFPLLAQEPAWSWTLGLAGSLSVVLAGIWALRHESLKGLLAYSTIGQYGYIFLGLSLGTKKGLSAALYAFVLHAVIKAGLFLVAGGVTYETGAKRFAELEERPTAGRALQVLALGLTFALSGAPFAAAFYYKEELIHAADGAGRTMIVAVLLVGAALTAAYASRFYVRTFHPRRPGPRSRSSAPLSMLLPTGACAAIAVAVSFVPNAASGLVAAALSSVLGASESFETHVKPGPLMAASIAAVVLGGLGYAGLRLRPSWSRLVNRLPGDVAFGGSRVVTFYSWLSERTLDLHNGDLRRYLRVLLVGALVLGMAVVFAHVERPPLVLDEVDPLLLLALLITGAAASTLVISDYYLVMVLALNVTGFALAVVFLRLHAPNVAIAQVLVETLATLILVLALRAGHQIRPLDKAYSLPRKDRSRWPIALALGGVTGFSTYWARTQAASDPVGFWYSRHGAEASGATDLVAAVLADFRALDTLVELTVFTVTMLGVIALYRKRGELR